MIERAVAGIFLDMSLGKTSCVLAALKLLKDQGYMKRTLIIAPLRVCYAVWTEERDKWTDFKDLKIEILHGPKKDEALKRDADIYLINPDGLAWLMLGTKVKDLGCDVLVIDECFTAGTRISTPEGPRVIEELRVGEMVSTPVGPRRINKLMVRRSNRLVTLELSDGRSITCTENHPFFTDRGWVAAGLTEGENLVGLSVVPRMRRHLRGESTPGGEGVGGDLLEDLLKEADVGIAPRAARAGECAGREGIRPAYKARGRVKSVPSNACPEGAGHQKGSTSCLVRVDRIAHHEPGDIREVWNLEVEGCPHYFAEGVLVHNCDAFKHERTQRFKLLKYLIPTFRRRYILTGTPATNGLLDLHGQIYILDQGNALGRYITHYKQAYFDQSGYGGYTWTPKPGAADAIYEKLRPMVLRMDADDYISLPERIDNVVYVDLPAKARKVYSEIEIQFLTTLENGENITTPSAAAAGMKCRQIANGAMYRNLEQRIDAVVHSEEWVSVHDAKLEALEEIVGSQQGKPVLVAYEFEHDATRIRKQFPHAVFLADYTGTKIMDAINAWNRGEIQMLCAHPASCGHGLNLQGGGNVIVWFGLTFNLAHYQQLNARIRRSGSAHASVIVHHIVARRTVDEAVMKALKSKDKTQRDLLDALKDYSREVK